MLHQNLMLGNRWLMGVSEGKLHYVEVSTEKEPFMISSFSLGNLRVGQKLNYSCPTKVNRWKRTMPWILHFSYTARALSTCRNK
jgi:hypothetical protein